VAANQVPDFDDMHDIVVSEPVSWWPLAPGWYVLMLIFAMGMIWLGVKYWNQWKKNAYRRAALRELKSISPADLPALVKRVSLCIYPREQVATLSGEAWLEFLDQSGNTQDFTQGPGRHLLELSYNPNASNIPIEELTHIIRKWVG
jgi:hypothetical protein